jgi:hypothetical protein
MDRARQTSARSSASVCERNNAEGPTAEDALHDYLDAAAAVWSSSTNSSCGFVSHMLSVDSR